MGDWDEITPSMQTWIIFMTLTRIERNLDEMLDLLHDSLSETKTEENE